MAVCWFSLVFLPPPSRVLAVFFPSSRIFFVFQRYLLSILRSVFRVERIDISNQRNSEFPPSPTPRPSFHFHEFTRRFSGVVRSRTVFPGNNRVARNCDIDASRSVPGFEDPQIFDLPLPSRNSTCTIEFIAANFEEGASGERKSGRICTISDRCELRTTTTSYEIRCVARIEAKIRELKRS